MGMTGGTLTPKQLKCIYALGRAGCMDSEELHGVVYTAAKKEHVSELTVEEARRVIDRLKLLTGETPKRAADRATKGQVQLKDIPRLLRKTKCTPTEREVLALAGKAPLSTAELLLSMERGILIRKEEDILEKLYTSPEDTCSTLTDTVQITHAQYPILQAVSNLYLNQKILFQKI